MKKVLTAIFAFLFLFSAVSGAAAYVNAEEDTELAKNCKAAYLCDWHSGTRIYSKNFRFIETGYFDYFIFHINVCCIM